MMTRRHVNATDVAESERVRWFCLALRTHGRRFGDICIYLSPGERGRGTIAEHFFERREPGFSLLKPAVTSDVVRAHLLPRCEWVGGCEDTMYTP